MVKNPPANAGDTEDAVRSLGWEDPLEKEMTAHSSTLAWRTPWMEGPGGPEFMGLQRGEHSEGLSTHTGNSYLRKPPKLNLWGEKIQGSIRKTKAPVPRKAHKIPRSVGNQKRGLRQKLQRQEMRTLGKEKEKDEQRLYLL